MNPEHDRLNQLFTEALSQATPEDRDRYLAGACGADAELRRQVDSPLLSAHAESGEFLVQSVMANGNSIGEGPGSIIGRYKLLQQIGEGGFGIVFMAEQQEPVHRMVALKIIKAGMDTKEVVARFEAERQALALMEHPNVARVLDGGTTASGRPYFVMDLVKGLPVTEFCERKQLSIEERLRLFLKVCSGVEHAHQKGLIHRDLKPHNVLVTLQNGEPVPKVIDFGVAKAIGQKLTERTLFTRFEQLIGTPAYMSPEQAEWGSVDIDTRSDVYSLGVLLYELLTGTTPIEKSTLARAGLDDLRRMIRETDPPTPSTRLNALVAAGGSRRNQSSNAMAGPDPKRPTERDSTTESSPGPKPDLPAESSAEPVDDLSSDSHGLRLRERLDAVRGDLDWIVMKMLEKDRSRRYETINALVLDLGRYLTGDPVLACPPSRSYRAGKFIRRHRLGVLAATGVTLSLIAGLILALVGFAKARRAQQTAEKETAVAKAINDFFIDDVLSEASPEKRVTGDITVRELFAQAADKINGKFTNQPLVEAAVRTELAYIYIEMDDLEKAEPHVRRALEITSRECKPDDIERLRALWAWNTLNARKGNSKDSVGIDRQIVEGLQKQKGSNDDETLMATSNLGYSLHAEGRLDLAEDLIRNVLQRTSELLIRQIDSAG